MVWLGSSGDGLVGTAPTKYYDNIYFDSDSEDEEPKKYRIEIKPVHPNNSHHTMASLDELKVSIGNITLSPAVSVSKKISKFPLTI